MCVFSRLLIDASRIAIRHASMALRHSFDSFDNLTPPKVQDRAFSSRSSGVLFGNRVALARHCLLGGFTQEKTLMKAVIAGLAILFAIAPSIFAQEIRSEISVQGTRFFTHHTTDSGLARSDANSGGLQVGYRFRINRWLSAESLHTQQSGLQRRVLQEIGAAVCQRCQ